MHLSVQAKLTAAFGVLLDRTVATGDVARRKLSTMSGAVDRPFSQRLTMVGVAKGAFAVLGAECKRSCIPTPASQT